ncbi:DUF2634 domain-containing protein [Paenibacillus psychroresistens]|uniref:DUF2634 domain-containing protein n=1 Tax=Paenibacillus psychroresistens TaxID=1778678 RepID=A0A6B8REU8_9BACL|nr:DUF2634 domain-containing protein [Paenibacillus psychroresistens]QGQ93958.1 DUF2634 domain-containing protein [Paenibacillus psychroresistens]
MIPQGGIGNTQELEEGQIPSKTYRMDVTSQRIVGFVDGLEAIKQAVFKILQTERFAYPIYSGNYGSEFAAAIGRDSILVESRLTRIIQEALLQDDRITDIQDLQITFLGDEATAAFTVVSQFGSFQVVQEV